MGSSNKMYYNFEYGDILCNDLPIFEIIPHIVEFNISLLRLFFHF